LDKKLIVDIENIEYKSKKSKVKNSFEDIKQNIDHLPNLLKIFQRIHVERLKIDGNEFTLSLNEEALYLDNKFINLSSKVKFLSNQVVFDLYSLYLKDVEVLFDGKVKLDYFKEQLNIFGKYFYKDIEGQINLEMNDKLAQFYLNSNSFKSLKFIKKFTRLPKEAEAWMYDNVEGNIQLKEFYGKFDLENNRLLENSLRGKAVIDKAKIRFHKDLKTVNTKRTELEYEKEKLSFKLVEPKYAKKSLKGSSVYIEHLTSEKKGQVVVNIKANTKLDKDILGILKAYDIKLPLVQKTGNTNASLTLKIPYSLNRGMSTNGKFIVKKANIDLNGFNFYTKSANVYLKGTKVEIRKADFVHKDMIKANLDLDINTQTLSAKGNALIKSFYIANKDDEIINIKNKKTPLSFSFKDDVKIQLDAINTNITIKDRIYVSIKELDKIYDSSKLLQELSVRGGNIYLNIKDENDISFEGFVYGLDYPIYKKGKKVDSLNIKGSILNNLTRVNSSDGNVFAQIRNDKLSLVLKNLAIHIDTKNKQNQENIPKFDLKVNNVSLKLNNDTYHLTKGLATVSSKRVDFDAQVVNINNLPIKKNGREIKKLDVYGSVTSKLTDLKTKDKKLVLKIKNDKLNVFLDGYDVYVETDAMENEDEISEFNIKAKNSNIYVNEKFKFLADNYDLRVRKDMVYFNLKHKKTAMTYKESSDGMVDVYANDISDEFINTIFDKKIIKGGKLMLLANGVKSKLKGKLILTDVKIENLAILNNILLFIHSSPALINPFLAIPSVVGAAANGGFNLTGYKATTGIAEFLYNKNKKTLAINKVVTVGNGIDFDGSGLINLDDMTLNSKIKLIFFKNYSKIVSSIPVVNYVLLGKNKRVETKINVFGPLENPKISTNLTKDAFSVPLNIAKRILTSPVELLNFIKGKDKKKK